MLKFISVLLSIILLVSCSNTKQVKEVTSPNISVLKDRSTKSKVIFIENRSLLGPAIISTLQDMGYQIDYAAYDFRLISAQKRVVDLERVTITYSFSQEDFVQVRANFSQFDKAIPGDSVQYQMFFSKLSKNIFLMSNGII
jgi:uncharacterized lipoprotein YajG